MQNELFKRTDHSGRGLEFEQELEAANAFYLQKGLCDVVKNPSAWDFARGRDWHTYKNLWGQKHSNSALTGDGRYLMRIRSDVDFSGGGRLPNGKGSFSIAFDAKESGDDRFPFGNIKSHQVHRLKQSAKCGGIAGVFIKMKKADRVFFLSVERLQTAYEKWEINRAVGRQTKRGEASFSIEDLERIGVEIFKGNNGLWDWLKIFDSADADKA